MADGESVNTRPNIRIEIHNNLMESMEVEDAEVETSKLSDSEEGEIIEETSGFDDFIDNNITYPSRPTPEQQKKPWVSVSSKGFTTGINIFDKEEREKLSERAKRFALDPKDVTNFTEEDLQSLHDSLGITGENEKDIRLEALHIRGTDEMSSGDVLDYFSKYCPSSIEWISDDCCNVVWEDKITSARALFYLSRSIKGMPVVGTCDPFASSKDDNEKGKSVLLKNNNREIQLEDEVMEKDNGEVCISDITVPIPPGYWRLGVTHMKSKCILMRFTLKSDKKPFKAEKFSEYYKKYGNPNFGGLKGIISESKKAQFRGIFERNKEIKGKNPWGDLAKTWSRDKRTEEIVVPVEEVPQPNPKLKHRLGFKRSQNVAFEEKAEEKPVEKPKVPRMRMYADEEEDRIKRKKELEALKRIGNAQKSSEHNDLRNVIRRRDHVKETNIVEEVAEPEEHEDLGSKLMNRRLKFQFIPNPNAFDKSITSPHKRVETTDVRKRLEHRSEQMTKQHRFREELLKHKRYKSPPPPTPPQATSRNRNSTKYYSEDEDEEGEIGDQNDEEMYYSDDDTDMKTNSKVTVVIKKHKQPTVASTVWSRVNASGNIKPKQSVKERLNTPRTDSLEGRIGRMRSRTNRDSTNSSSSDDTSDSEANSGSSDVEINEKEDKIKPSIVDRPGFRNELNVAEYKTGDHKSPLRIEINNDHFQK